MCRIKLSLRLYWLPHTEHAKLKPPECNFRCRFMVPACVKDLPHTGHGNTPSFVQIFRPTSPSDGPSICWTISSISVSASNSALAAYTSFSTLICCRTKSSDDKELWLRLPLKCCCTGGNDVPTTSVKRHATFTYSYRNRPRNTPLIGLPFSEDTASNKAFNTVRFPRTAHH